MEYTLIARKRCCMCEKLVERQMPLNSGKYTGAISNTGAALNTGAASNRFV
jgi:hypothetical protein